MVALKPVSTGSSDTGDSKIAAAPSAMENSRQPFLARQLSIEKDILREANLLKRVQEIDSYIISLVKERQWVDTEESYNAILKEISKSLGLNEHLDLFARIDKLLLGTKLLKEQRYHEKLAKALSANIQNLKQTP